MAGYLYAVCNAAEHGKTKCGLTTAICPAAYCIREYSRTMPELATRRFLHVPDARLGERLLFAAMDQYRVDPRHEVFNISDDAMHAGFDSVREAFAALGRSNPAMAPLDVRPMTVEEHYLHRRNLVLGKRKERSQAAQERQAERVAALEEERRALRRKKDEERARAAEQERLAAQADKDGRREELIDKLRTFIDEHCVRGPTSSTRVETGVFRQAFQEYSRELVSAQAMAAYMKECGFFKKRIRTPDANNVFFAQIVLKK